MFVIKSNRFYVTRGDKGTFVVRIPYRDYNGYFKYVNGDDDIFWYDAIDLVVYDSNYVVSTVVITTLTLVLYQFQIDDVVRIKVYEKQKMDDIPVMDVATTVTVEADNLTVSVTSNDTRIGDPINKDVDYWYEITLNDDQTIIGYDSYGPKIFTLYPEGEESV